jgi:uncharacterized membrane protein YjgN (DUF898 family)
LHISHLNDHITKRKGSEFFFMNLKNGFLTIITFGICAFWAARDTHNYFVNNVWVVQGKNKYKLTSTAQAGGFFELFLFNLFAIIFSLGLARPWAEVRHISYILENLDLPSEIDPDSILQTETMFSDATADEVDDLLDLELDFV